MSKDKITIAEHLSLIERDPMAAHEFIKHEQKGFVIGITGPPGVGKSTLTDALIAGYRAVGRSVAVIAIDPSSHMSGGALLGDRIRFAHSNDGGDDDGVFIRSQATGGQLGGLAPATMPSAFYLASLFDVVLIESVGVGQSEIDIMKVSDCVLVCVQPASGDAIQALKAGVMEIADIFVVTKKDLGSIATLTRSNLESMTAHDSKDRAIFLVSAAAQEGIQGLMHALDEFRTRHQDAIKEKREKGMFDWYLQVAAQGDAKAQTALGWMYKKGHGVKQDFKQSADWYEKAALQGDAEAQFNLGAMYSDGRGRLEDFIEAYAWLNLAAANGHESAKSLKEELAKEMTKEDISKA